MDWLVIKITIIRILIKWFLQWLVSNFDGLHHLNAEIKTFYNKIDRKEKYIWTTFEHGIFKTYICFTSDLILCMFGRTFWQHLVFMFGLFFFSLHSSLLVFQYEQKWLDLAWPHVDKRNFFSVFYFVSICLPLI